MAKIDGLTLFPVAQIERDPDPSSFSDLPACACVGSGTASDAETAADRKSPLARQAARAPLADSGCLTEYRNLRVKSLLTRSASARGLPFTHSINPYRGCEFACRYCYARYTHEFLDLHSPEAFERQIFMKQNAAWLLRQELPALPSGTEIALGTATDPYQPIERRAKITRSLLEVFAEQTGYRLGIVTKSTLILRDVDLLARIAAKNRLSIHLTVTTMNPHLARLLEPRAPRPDLRMIALGKLRRAGLRAGVLCSPLMPGISDSRASIEAVAMAAKQADASSFSAGALFLKPCSQPTFLAFVQDHFPEQLAGYRRLYESNAFLSAAYRNRVDALVTAICKQHGLERREERDSLAVARAAGAAEHAETDGTGKISDLVEIQGSLGFA